MSLKDDKQQNIQMELDFSSVLTGETRGVAGEETESPMATNEPENPARTNRLMEEVCERENLKEALRQVKGNRAAPLGGVSRPQACIETPCARTGRPRCRLQRKRGRSMGESDEP